MTTEHPTLDLLTAPWIAVTELSSTYTSGLRVGLRELFDRAHDLTINYTAFEEAAMVRLLSAVHDAAAGPTTVKEWDAAWAAPTLELSRISDYFDRWHDRFDAFHPEYPFMQCAALTRASHSIGHLNLARGGSGGGTFFESRLSRGVDQHPPMEPAQAFLAALVMLGYDTAGIKSPHPDDPSGKTGNPVGVLGTITHTHITTGRSLKDTLLLSLPPAPRAPGDSPVWERPSPGPSHTVRPVAGRLDLLTWPSRRIRLLPAGDTMVHSAAFYPGDRAADRSADTRARTDPMAAWQLRHKGTKLSARPAPVSNQVGIPRPWAATALLTGPGYCPALLHVVDACERGILDPGLRLAVTMVHADHSGRNRGVLSGITTLYAPLGLAGTLADPDERGQLAARAAEAIWVEKELTESFAAITGRTETAVQAAIAMRDLFGDWAELAYTVDRGAAVREWRDTLLAEVGKAVQRMGPLPVQQKAQAGIACDKLRAVTGGESHLKAKWPREMTQLEPSPPGGRPSQMIEAFGRQMTLPELAQHPSAKVTYATIRRRIREGMSPEEAATTSGHRGRRA